jgi:hypothetical protein
MPTSRPPLRFTAWFGTTDKGGLIYRSWMKNQGMRDLEFQGRPIQGIYSSWSELTPRNSQFHWLAERVRRGVLEAGGYPDGTRRIVHSHIAGRRRDAFGEFRCWLPLINCENRHGGLLSGEALMQEGDVIACEAPRHPYPEVRPATTHAGLIETAWRLLLRRCAAVAEFA